MHTSIIIPNTIEFINIEPFKRNPLISKCQIKVCYVGEEPNRNRSVITKEVAAEMGASLRGAPIVAFYNETSGDFEEHNRAFEIIDGQLKIIDKTRPYGFVDLNAKVWFAKYLDDDQDEREYLCTEGWLWTSQYPEAWRVISKGNNQSMELDEKIVKATWTKDDSGKPQFLIINEAIISKLCILGEEHEPCFEGASITQFSLETEFKEQVYSMINELSNLLKEEGGKDKVVKVEIGDSVWNAVYELHGDKRQIIGFYETEEGATYAVVKNRADEKLYRINYTMTEDTGFVPSETLVEVTSTFSEAAQFTDEEVEAYYASKKSSEEEDKTDKTDNNNFKNHSEEKKCPECDKPLEECECKKKEYSLDEIPEYIQLKADYERLNTTYSELQVAHDTLVAEHGALQASYNTLVEFKNATERKEKEELIKSFCMLSDEDKKNVVDNIDKYSLHDIESELSIICVRNKVNFNLETEEIPTQVTTYNLEQQEDTTTPAWVKRVLEVSKSL